MTEYLFLLNDSFTIMGKGKDLKDAKADALKKLKKAESYPIWKEGAPRRIVGYDVFDKDGLSSHNWKKVKL